MKKILSILLVFVMVMALSVTAFAEEPTYYDLWVAGVQVTDANKGDVLNDGTVRFTPADGANPATLTLNNANIRVNAGEYGIKTNIALTIVLNEANTIEGGSAAIYGVKDVTIEGAGSLTAVGDAGIFAANFTINGGTVTATGTGDSSFGIGTTGSITISNGTVEATGTYYGIYSNEVNITVTGDYTVFAGNDEASAQRVDAPTADTYTTNKYVKIVFPEMRSTTITYQVDPTYTVTIPATVTLGQSVEIKAEDVVLPLGEQVEVSLTNANGFKVSTDEGAELSYAIVHGTTEITEGYVVLTANPLFSDSCATTVAFIATESAQFAGEYTGTVTFTVAVKEGNLIKFTVEDYMGSNELIAEAGMVWSEWIGSAYDIYGYIWCDEDYDNHIWWGEPTPVRFNGVQVEYDDVIQPNGTYIVDPL